MRSRRGRAIEEGLPRGLPQPRPGPARQGAVRRGARSTCDRVRNWERRTRSGPTRQRRWSNRCERLVELDAKLPKVLKGEVQPADVGGRLGWPRFASTSRSTQPPSASTATLLPNSRTWPTTYKASPVTMPPAPRPWPVAARARTRTKAMTRSVAASDARPWSGCGPTWPRIAGCWTRSRTRLTPRYAKTCSTGSRTRISPACVVPRPWPSCPRPSGRSGRSCGRSRGDCGNGQRDSRAARTSRRRNQRSAKPLRAEEPGQFRLILAFRIERAQPLRLSGAEKPLI